MNLKKLRQQSQGQELLNIEIESDSGNIKDALIELASVETVNEIENKNNAFRVQSKPEKSSRKAVFDLCVKNRWTLLEMHGMETKLEDVFRDLTN